MGDQQTTPLNTSSEVKIKTEDAKEEKFRVKSSDEILSDLFSTFNATPPDVNEMLKKVKKNKKHRKKSKKRDHDSDDSGSKHKKKSKKSKKDSSDHKKKHKKRKRHSSDSSSDSKSDDEVTKKLKQIKNEPLVNINLFAAISEDLKQSLIKKEGDSSSKEPIKTVTSNTLKVKEEKKMHSDGEIDSSDEHKAVEKEPKSNSRIKITNLKDSEVFKATLKEKEVQKEEVSSDSMEDLHKELKNIRRSHEKSRSRHDDRDKHRHNHRHEDKHKPRSSHRHSSRDRDSSRHRHDRERDRKSRRRSSRSPHRVSVKDRLGGYHKDSFYSFYGSHYSDRRDRRHSRSRSRSNTRFDKKKLLAIARKNAIQMLKNGQLPGAAVLGRQAQEKVIAAIKAGGKTIEELTDFCKSLSEKEKLGELSSPERTDVDDDESDTERPFMHPFALKERTSGIVMNIPNSTPLPIKPAPEISMDKSVLSMQFPVSSGQHHRRNESEWVPVSPKKIEEPPPKPKPAKVNPKSFGGDQLNTIKAIEAPPDKLVNNVVSKLPPPGPQVMPPMGLQTMPPPGPQAMPPSLVKTGNANVGALVSERLLAMRKLQENPNDVEALNKMWHAQEKMQTWASRHMGQFTGSTGAQILSAAQLSSGQQAWARKDQLQNATPVSGGMGMHLLQKMGWNPGEGLGKEKSGALEPLLLEVKLDKRGLVANEEAPFHSKKQKAKNPRVVVPAQQMLANKHPVSLLGEIASKKKFGMPQYECVFESGPSHSKQFLFKVTINGQSYQPSVVSPNKKQAKSEAAKVCLQQLGCLPL